MRIGRRRFRRRSRIMAALLIAAALLVGVRVAWYVSRPAGETTVESLVAGSYRVRRVIDGYQLLISDPHDAAQCARIRLLGITPATGPGRHSAAQALSEAIAQDQIVSLRLDRRRVDVDGVFLAYVYVENRLLNAELVRSGLARVDSRPTDSGPIVRQLRQAQQEAQQAHRGIWSG